MGKKNEERKGVRECLSTNISFLHDYYDEIQIDDPKKLHMMKVQIRG